MAQPHESVVISCIEYSHGTGSLRATAPTLVAPRMMAVFGSCSSNLFCTNTLVLGQKYALARRYKNSRSLSSSNQGIKAAKLVTTTSLAGSTCVRFYLQKSGRNCLAGSAYAKLCR